MPNMKQILTLLFLLYLSACAKDTFKKNVPEQELAKVSEEKATSQAQTVDGIEIWSTGVPARKYRVLGIIHDVRRNEAWQINSYMNDIARATKKAGGDAAIIIIADSKSVYKMGVGCDASIEATSDASATPRAECEHAEGASFSSQAPGEESTIYSQNRESTSVPLEYKDSHILVIKYLDNK